MSNMEVTYTFNQDSLRRLVRGIRNWGNDEVESDRLKSIGDLELAEMLIAAIRQWDGPGEYHINGPCDVVGDLESHSFPDFNSFVSYLSNWSRTMRLTKEKDIRYSNEPMGGYED